eukprot:3222536-Pyramimonas_sp.AAC.2
MMRRMRMMMMLIMMMKVTTMMEKGEEVKPGARQKPDSSDLEARGYLPAKVHDARLSREIWKLAATCPQRRTTQG